ncbi:MAG: AAA family ATPase [Pyrinomonadaceae bacterium]
MSCTVAVKQELEIAKSAVKDAADRYVAATLSIFPVRTDGSKAPIVAWKGYQSRIADESEVDQWFRTECGIAIVGGKVSGNLEILDFDEPEVFEPWCVLVERFSPGLIDRLPLVLTPSGGFHLYYRNTVEVDGNLKLAQRAGENGRPNVLIETRGEGGYVIAPPSPAECHPARKPYELLRGDLTNIPVIERHERESLLECARSFNQYVSKGHVVKCDARWSGQGRPGDLFNSQFTLANWGELLERHGWSLVDVREGVEYWQRPGKVGPGISATVNFGGGNLLYVFSSNAAPFDSERAYTPFVAYALLEHGGDFSAAAKALAGHGYEGQTERRSAGLDSPTAPAAVTNVWGNLGEFLDTDFPPVEEVLSRVERGTLSQFCATTSAGKTTLLLNAGLALAAGQQFLPLVPEAGRPRRVMYVDFETGCSKMKQGIAKMLSRDPYNRPEVQRHVRENFILLVDTEIDDIPLSLSRPEHLEFVQRKAQEFGAELVVMDNASSGFELDNDSGNSEVASKVMLPLKNFAKRTNAATIFVHHTGKAGEGSKSTVDAMMGRGASNYANLSRSIYGLVLAEDLGQGYVVMHNTKNKCGPLPEPVTMRLDFATLWFEQISAAQRIEVTSEAIHELVLARGEASVSEIKAHFMQFGVSDRTIERRINDAVELGLIWRKNQRAKYQAVSQYGAEHLLHTVDVDERRLVN